MGCASAGYTLCLGLSLVYLFASSLRNLAVPNDVYSNLSITVDPEFDGVGLMGFNSSSNCLLSFLSSMTLVFSAFLYYGFVLWGRGLRTEWVSFTFSQPCITDHF